MAQQQQTATTVYRPGDAVMILPQGTYGLRASGNTTYGVVEYVVTDTPPDEVRGPLYHIRLTDPQASGWFGLGVARNYADELQPNPATAPQDGETLGVFTFEQHADALGHAGVWVYGASYGDDLRTCWRRAVSLTESFGVEFYAMYVTEYMLRQRGPFTAIHEAGYYAATSVHNTPELRRIVQRAYDRARGMTPRESTEREVAE